MKILKNIELWLSGPFLLKNFKKEVFFQLNVLSHSLLESYSSDISANFEKLHRDCLMFSEERALFLTQKTKKNLIKSSEDLKEISELIKYSPPNSKEVTSRYNDLVKRLDLAQFVNSRKKVTSL